MFLLLPSMNAITRPLRESADQRRERQAAYFRELAEMNMDAARIAHAAIKQARDAGPETQEQTHAEAHEDAHEPTLDLARATRSVALAVNAENDLFRAERAPRPPASDTRRPLLCQALLQAAKAEPDPALRAALVREIPRPWSTKPSSPTPTPKPPSTNISSPSPTASTSPLDLATLPDELLGMEPRTYIRDG